MPKLKNMPISAASLETNNGKLKFSTLLAAFNGLPDDELAVFTHFLQTRGSKAASSFMSDVKDSVPADVFKFVKDKDIVWDVPFPPKKNPDFTFIDLFAGIGGMRIAFQELNGQCVFSSEWDRFAKVTYRENFGEVPFGDITKIDADDIPKHDVLVAGFPCQAFSIAGFKGGFDDTRGTLFFDVARIIKARRPEAFLLENVKGLAGHDKKRTLSVILRTLREDLGYFVPDPQIINARDFGVPQNRERIFIVGFRNKNSANKFLYPKQLEGAQTTISDIVEDSEVSVKYYLSNQLLRTLIKHRARHEAKGHGFGYEIIPDDGVAHAIVGGGMGRERNLLVDKRLTNFKPITHIIGTVNKKGIRRMTPLEWARLQGFPDKFLIPVSDAQAYKQFGNSVAVPAVQATGRALLKALEG
jgi:DNA (cytosine-5)-methyltransferase 1